MSNRLLTEEEASLKTGRSKKWFRNRRLSGGGPPYRIIHGSIRYEEEVLAQWMNCRNLDGVMTDYGNFDKYSDIAKWW